MLHGRSRPLPLGTRLTRPVQRLWATTTKAFAQHPFLIKTVSSGFGFAFGDVLFQLGTTRRKGLPLDWRPLGDHGRRGAGGWRGRWATASSCGWRGHVMTAAPHR